jgi:hypothetical protein
MKFLYRNHKQNNGTKIKILLPAYNQPKIKNDRKNAIIICNFEPLNCSVFLDLLKYFFEFFIPETL